MVESGRRNNKRERERERERESTSRALFFSVNVVAVAVVLDDALVVVDGLACCAHCHTV